MAPRVSGDVSVTRVRHAHATVRAMRMVRPLILLRHVATILVATSLVLGLAPSARAQVRKPRTFT